MNLLFGRTSFRRADGISVNIVARFGAFAVFFLTLTACERAPSLNSPETNDKGSEFIGEQSKSCIDQATAKIKATGQRVSSNYSGYLSSDGSIDVWVGIHHWKFKPPHLGWIEYNKPFPGAQAFAQTSLVDWSRGNSESDREIYPDGKDHGLYGQLRIFCIETDNQRRSMQTNDRLLMSIDSILRSPTSTKRPLPEIGLIEWRESPTSGANILYVSDDSSMKNEDGSLIEIGCQVPIGTSSLSAQTNGLNQDRCRYGYVFAPGIAVQIDFPVAYLPEWRKAIKETKQHLQVNHIRD